MLDVVAQRLPRVLRDALEDRQKQKPEKDNDAVADGWVAVNGRDQVLDDGRPGEDVRREVIHRQSDGHERHQVKETGSSVGKNTREDAPRVFFGVRDDAPNLLAQHVGVPVDVLRGHLVAAGFCCVGRRHDSLPRTETLEPSPCDRET